MPIVLGLGDDWKDPLNLFGGKANTGVADASATQAVTSDVNARKDQSAVIGLGMGSNNSAPKQAPVMSRDRDDIINTIIAEAGGEGDAGMAAVASVIRNRAAERGLDPASVVRQPKQFAGYENPGRDAVKAMQDPAMRERAARIYDQVTGGEIDDPTGGADHYHANSVSPSWSKTMPETAQIGNHLFYRSQPDRNGHEQQVGRNNARSTSKDGGNPFDAILTGKTDKATTPHASAAKNFLQTRTDKGPEAIAGLKDAFAVKLVNMFQDAPPEIGEGLGLYSAYRSPEHQARIIADAMGKGQYGFGRADRAAWQADVSKLGPKEAGEKWASAFRSSGMSAYIAKPGYSKHQEGDAGDLSWKGRSLQHAPKEVIAWVRQNAPKYRLNVPLSNEDWHIEDADARKGGKVQSRKQIVIDENYTPQGQMFKGFDDGDNPLAVAAEQARISAAQRQADAAAQTEQNRINASNEQNNAALEQQASAMGQPGRYRLMDENAAQEFSTGWKEKNQSGGLAGDLVREWGIGAGQASQSISNLNRLLISKLPDGDRINAGLDRIDRWLGGGTTMDERRQQAIDHASASLTDESKASLEKTVFKKDSWELNGALSDPRWYMLQIAQSGPSMAATMAPTGLLARGAFVGARAAGATVEAAAASAAKVATIAGGVSEGVLGGAQSAQSIKDKIAALPREQLLQSDAVKSLIDQGKTPDEAIAIVSDNAQVQGFITAGVATGIFGGMGDRAMAKIIGEGIGGGIARRVASGAARGFVGEGLLEEMPQNIGQTIAENAAMQRVDPKQSLTEGVAEAAVSGAAVGGAMGAGMGGAGGALRRAEAHEQSADAATDDGAYIRVNPGDNSTGHQQTATTANGPIGRAVRAAEEAQIQRNGGVQPETALDGKLRPGTTVRIDAEGMEPIMATVQGHDGDETIVFDSSTGELLQVPSAQVTSIAASPDQAKAASGQPDPLPEYSNDPALEPAAPIAGETTSEGLPPRAEQKPATERFPSAPNPGESVIVDDEHGGRFAAKVQSYERDENGNEEVLVRRDDGKEVQVPIGSLAVSKLNEAEAEAQELERNPAAQRDKPELTPTRRRVRERTMEFPDALHARLYDLGAERRLTKRALGASQLDLGKVNSPEINDLSKEFKVSTQAVEAMADDYRYRVENAARSARSDLPQKVAPVNDGRLLKWQAEFAKENGGKIEGRDDDAVWWNGELTAPERRKILDVAGIKRSEKMPWEGFTPGIRKKLQMFRPDIADAAALADTVEAPATVDAAAHEAATSPLNDRPEPSQAQKEAGNYKVGRVSLGGLDISVENPAGSSRKGVDPNGKAWSVEMKSHYGYIRGTVGKDKDHIDAFVKPGTEALDDVSPVFVVDQKKANGHFDEHKVMLGFDSQKAAEKAYLTNYSKGWSGMGAVTATTLGEFKAWLATGKTDQPFAAPETQKSPQVSENKIFTADAAEKARALLRSKLNQLNSGIDPEIMQAGITLAGYHIEKGARTFAAYAQAMLADLGEVARPYLKSWYMGVKYDPRAHAFDGMSAAAEVDAADVNTVPMEGSNGVRELEKSGEGSLEGIPADAVSATEGSRETGRGAGAGSRADLSGDGPVGAERVQPRGQLADDPRKVSAPTRGRDTNSARSSGQSEPDRHVSQRQADDGHLEEGPFGPILRGYEGRWRDAALELERRQSGDAIGALHHADVGPIDLVWGKEGTGRSDGFGLSKLVAWHPEALQDLQGLLDGMKVVSRSENRIRLENPGNSQAGIRLDWDGQAKHWLMSAFELGKRRDERSTIRLIDLWKDASSSPPQKVGKTDTGISISNIHADVQSAATPAQNQPVNYTITDADQIGQGGDKAKFNGNVNAIKLLRTLEKEGRSATRQEQAALAKWVGWGGLRSAFFRDDGSVAKGWEKQAKELRELLTPDEYRAAESSTRNAHYTAPEIVDAVWTVSRRLGFKGGQVLEPSVGSGNFLGLMPGDVKQGSRVTGVELDHITGNIAKNLYPDANIQAPKGFESLSVPDGYFDLAIGNPPFGSERLYDKERRNLNKLSIHNYFFAKSVAGLRPGGVLAMVVTSRFLDGNKDNARKLIAKQADLVGAIRLPNNAFLKNAGTEVTTDIVILRKRAEGETPASTAWTEVGDYRGKDGKTVPLNRYFVENPHMMLGDFGAYGTMYGPDEPALLARAGQDLSGDLKAAIDTLPKDIMPAPGTIVQSPDALQVSVSDVPVGSIFMAKDGALHTRLPDRLGERQSEPLALKSDTAKDRMAGMVRVRDAFTRLRRAQVDPDANDAQLDNLRKRLNTLYDSFHRKHGPINAAGNKRLFRDDPTWPQISALENDFDQGISLAVAKTTGEAPRAPSAKKAAIFTKRTQQPYSAPTNAATAKDALAQVLNDLGRVDLAAMSRLYGNSADQIVDELGPLLYKTPAGSFETADAYLSGNVKAKLAEVERASAEHPEFRRNVAALKAVIPDDIEAVDIDVKPGAPWLPPKHVEAFIHHIAEVKDGAKAFYSKAQGTWSLDIPRPTPAADAMWATGRAGVGQILSAVLNGKPVQVYDKTSDGGRVLNQAETDAANQKASRIATEWNRWLWEDDARRDELAQLYNDTFNTDVVRRFDGAHLTLPGKVGDDIIDLRQHQKAFVWRTLQTPVSLADHTVGAGKTFALIASAMEKRRTGQAKKPMFAVPNHLVGQWAADFIKLYPGAKVLAASKKDFEAANRKRLFARVATGDWDAVIVAHSQFGLMGVSPQIEEKFISQQLQELEASIAEMRSETGEKSRNVAQMAKQRENLQSKLKNLLDAGRKDDGLTFDELGVDALYVDEFHEFKNLAFATGMQRVAGLGNPAGSQKAADMYMKIQHIQEKTGGNIVVATGTPLSNTMAEMYTLMRYLAGKALRNMGLSHFDAWARVFGDVVTDWELSPSGQYKMATRFAKFVNIPELMRQYLAFGDVISNDDIRSQMAAMGKTLPLPKVKGGKPTLIVVKPSSDQTAYIGEGTPGPNGELIYPSGSLVYRAENLPKKAEKGADNMLKVMSDARKAALDMRLIDPSYPDNPGSKINRASAEMKRIYDQWQDQRGTQLVFIDLSTPKKAKTRQAQELNALIKAAEGGDDKAQAKLDAMSPDEFEALNSKFSVYDDLKDKLIATGVPSEEIAFIHDANTDLQKEELFGKVRSGRVRFLFGSTAKMGAGTNVQNRLVALHHIDAPWRPSDLEQRDGRIIRQGNELYTADPEGFEVEILRYATEKTLDARQWQGIEAKARFIQQVRKGDTKQRSVEDIGGEVASAAEMKAVASGNPLILEEMQTRKHLRTLEGQASEHDRAQHRIKGKIRDINSQLAAIEQRADAVNADAARAADFAEKPFAATVDGVEMAKPKEFGAAVLSAMRSGLYDGVTQQQIGHIGQFPIQIEQDYGSRWMATIQGAQDYTILVSDIAQQDPTGLAMQLTNTVRKMVAAPLSDRDTAAELKRQIPALEKQLGPWDGQKELEETTARHTRLIDALKPKAKAETNGAVTVEDSAAEEPEIAVANKRKDAQLTLTVEDLQSLPKPPRQDNQSIKAWAFDAVVKPGERFGHEYLVAIDDDGSVVEYGTAHKDDYSGMSRSLMSAMINPDRRVVIYHNHPRSTPLSIADISALAHSGMHAIWAVGHDGRESRAQLTEAAKARMTKLYRRSLPTDEMAARNHFIVMLQNAHQLIQSFLQGEIDDGRITAELAEHIDDNIRIMPAQLAGVVEHTDNQPYDTGTIPGLQKVIEDAGLKLSREFHGKDHGNIRIDRAAKPVRHIAEMARVRQNPQFSAAVKRPEGISETGPRLYPGQKSQNFARISESRIIQELKGKLTDLKPSVLAAVPLNYFAELARPNMTAVSDYLRVKRMMDTYRGQKHEEADKIAGEWLKYTRLGFLGKDKSRSQLLSELMHDSTLAGIDPSQIDEETVAKPGYDLLRKRYMAMPPAGRALYAKVRDAYKTQAEELDNILLDNVRKAQEIGAKRAADAHRKTLKDIAEAGLTGLDLRKAEEDAMSAYKAAVTRSTWGGKARMTRMRQSFEASRVQAPYFPLGRFGNYFVTVRDGENNVLSFSKFEKAADRDRFAAKIEREMPNARVEAGVMEDRGKGRAAMDPRMVAEIEELLGAGNADPDLMDQIWQRYLETMPDLSMRKRFIHRKGTAGFHQDALRTFSSHMFHAAHQMARAKYGLELQELVNDVNDQAKEADDLTSAMRLSNEMSKRHDWVMNPTGSKVAQTMTSTAFVWFLGLSPASAAVNLTQTAIMGVPILGGRFGSLRKASSALGKAALDTIKGKGSLANASLSKDERAALDMFYQSGLIDRTQSHDLAGVGNTGVNYSPVRARVMAFISGAFHRAEVVNREVTAMAAYRMAREAGESHIKAVDIAHDLTWKTHFDYSNSSRPRVMQNDLAKVALVFRQFQVNMLYRIFRDVHQAVKGESVQAKREARYQLAGLSGMMTLFGGVTGMVGFNLMMALAGAAFGDDDDPVDFEARFKADMVNILGPELGGMVLNGVPGHYLGISLSDRVGMADLWFRSPNQELQGKDEYYYWLSQGLGATAGLGQSMWSGVSLLSEGKVARGVEMLAPKFVRDAMKAYRYHNEGVVDLRGNELIPKDQITLQDAWLKQLLGFTPAKVAETYDRKNTLKNAETRVKEQRQELVNAWGSAVLEGDKAAARQVGKSIIDFNKSPYHRGMPITSDSLKRSLKTRASNRAKMKEGTLIRNKGLDRDLRGALAEPIY
jgi:N12 class adenine-specific DNA methylase